MHFFPPVFSKLKRGNVELCAALVIDQNTDLRHGLGGYKPSDRVAANIHDVSMILSVSNANVMQFLQRDSFGTHSDETQGATSRVSQGLGRVKRTS